MSVLLDTNLLTRSAQPGHPMYQDAVEAIDALQQQGETLCIVPQNLYEFWVVATRATVQWVGLDGGTRGNRVDPTEDVVHLLAGFPIAL
jgi:hypothetical protein